MSSRSVVVSKCDCCGYEWVREDKVKKDGKYGYSNISMQGFITQDIKTKTVTVKKLLCVSCTDSILSHMRTIKENSNA